MIDTGDSSGESVENQWGCLDAGSLQVASAAAHVDQAASHRFRPAPAQSPSTQCIPACEVGNSVAIRYSNQTVDFTCMVTQAQDAAVTIPRGRGTSLLQLWFSDAHPRGNAETLLHTCAERGRTMQCKRACFWLLNAALSM